MRSTLARSTAAVLLLVTVVTAAPPAEVHHIHGLAFDRRDPNILYIATHTGLVRVGPDGVPAPVSVQPFDFMGFTAHPSDSALMFASGHPDIPTYQRERVGNLGLLLSRDGGRTWQSVALMGRADFHALTYSPAEGGLLFGWTVVDGPALYRISVGSWTAERVSARGLSEVLSLTASPEPTGRLLAGTRSGLLRSLDAGRSWLPLSAFRASGAVPAVAFHTTDPQRVYAFAVNAGLLASDNAGDRWRATVQPKVDGPAVALAVGPGQHVAVATANADVSRSANDGREWQPVLIRGRPASR
jgi:photosystem II stability/assembly factor-like uncharacterized protein